MRLSRREFLGSAAAAAGGAAWARAAAPRWKKGRAATLFNGRNLEGWYTFLRHKGLNADPEGIFKAEDGVLHVLGQEFGYLATTAEYDDFHLALEFRWGERRFPPREKSRRDSGILYRLPAGQEDRLWPQSIECQIQEGDCGDVWLVSGVSLVVNGVTHNRYVQKRSDAEKRGKWNQVEVIAQGDHIAHLVNGTLVNEGTGATVSKGKIALQSEGAEIFFRKIELSPLTRDA
jgi:hypothetical protein